MNGLNENMVLDACERVFSHLSTIYCPIERDEKDENRWVRTHARTHGGKYTMMWNTWKRLIECIILI